MENQSEFFLDLHIHSKYSFDSISQPKKIIKIAKNKGLNGVAITDHNTIKGSLEAEKLNEDENFIVITGAEIQTEIGDVIGLFLNEEIKSRNSIEVIEEIHKQGGISVLPHPYKGHRLNDEIIRKVDAIEVFNSRVRKEDNEKAMKLAEQFKKPITNGSDAHFLYEIGRSKVIINNKDFMSSILNGEVKLENRKTPLYFENLSQITKSVKLRKYKEVPKQFMWLMVNMIKSISWKDK